MGRRKNRPEPGAPPDEPVGPLPGGPSPRLAALSIFALALSAYAWTLSPTVPGGDAGEFIAAVHRWGVPHPPGFPLYVLATRPFLALPLSAVAARINAASAVCDAGAAALISLSVAGRFGGWAGIAAGGMFAFSPGVWRYAVGAEVFALNNLLMGLLVWLTVRYDADRRTRWAYAAALVLGLAFSNHHISAICGGPLTIWAVWRTWPGLSERAVMARLAGLFALGLVPYLYLPVASGWAPPVAWGDQTSLSGLLDHVLRRDYGTLRLAGQGYAGADSFAVQIGYYVLDLTSQVGLPGLALALAGCGLAWRRREHRPLAGGLTAAYVVYLVFFHSLANLPVASPHYRAVVARFWQQPQILVCVALGAGVFEVGRRWPRGLVPLSVGLVTLQLMLHAGESDQRSNRVVEAYGRALLAPLPRGAMLLCRGDLSTNVTTALQLCAGVRPDITILNLSQLTYPWARRLVAANSPQVQLPGSRCAVGEAGAYDTRAFLDANIDRQPIYLCGGFLPLDASHERAFTTWPAGLVERVRRTSEEVDLEAWIAESARQIPTTLAPEPEAFPAGSWEEVVREICWMAHHHRAVKLLALARERGGDPRLAQAAVDDLETVAAHVPEAPAFVFKNTSMGYAMLAGVRSDAQALKDRAAREFLARAAPDDPDAVRLRALFGARLAR